MKIMKLKLRIEIKSEMPQLKGSESQLKDTKVNKENKAGHIKAAV